MARLLRRFIVLSLLAIFGLAIFRFQSAKWEFTGLMWRPTAAGQRSIAWRTRQEDFPVESLMPLPNGELLAIPDIQAVFLEESIDRKAWRIKRQGAVKDVFTRSWKAYKKNAWMHDEIAPLSGAYKDTFGGWGATLVDSLDTLWIMGMEREFGSAVAALNNIDFTETPHDMLNVFETTIRYLGGMLSAHDLSHGKYPILLRKATELGDMLYAAFDTPNRMPMTRWYWE